jgi:hypothetical protein
MLNIHEEYDRDTSPEKVMVISHQVLKPPLNCNQYINYLKTHIFLIVGEAGLYHSAKNDSLVSGIMVVASETC